MLDKLFSFLKTELTMSHMASVLNQVENLVSMFDNAYLKDGSTKDAALDVLSQLILSHKSTNTTTTTQK